MRLKAFKLKFYFSSELKRCISTFLMSTRESLFQIKNNIYIYISQHLYIIVFNWKLFVYKWINLKILRGKLTKNNKKQYLNECSKSLFPNDTNSNLWWQVNNNKQKVSILNIYFYITRINSQFIFIFFDNKN